MGSARGRVKLTYYLGGVRTSIQAYREYGKEVERGLQAHITRTAKSILAAAIGRVPTDTGALKRSGAVERLRRAGKVRGKVVAFNSDYAWWVEFGSGTEGLPRPPPFAAGKGVQPWAGTHDLPSRALSLALAQDVVKPRPFLKPAYIRARPRFYDKAEQIIFRDAPRKAASSTVSRYYKGRSRARRR